MKPCDLNGMVEGSNFKWNRRRMHKVRIRRAQSYWVLQMLISAAEWDGLVTLPAWQTSRRSSLTTSRTRTRTRTITIRRTNTFALTFAVRSLNFISYYYLMSLTLKIIYHYHDLLINLNYLRNLFSTNSIFGIILWHILLNF